MLSVLIAYASPLGAIRIPCTYISDEFKEGIHEPIRSSFCEEHPVNRERISVDNSVILIILAEFKLNERIKNPNRLLTKLTYLKIKTNKED